MPAPEVCPWSLKLEALAQARLAQALSQALDHALANTLAQASPKLSLKLSFKLSLKLSLNLSFKLSLQAQIPLVTLKILLSPPQVRLKISLKVPSTLPQVCLQFSPIASGPPQVHFSLRQVRLKVFLKALLKVLLKSASNLPAQPNAQQRSCEPLNILSIYSHFSPNQITDGHCPEILSQTRRSPKDVSFCWLSCR